jgi:Fe-S-cluster-containing dehydrogenase component
MDSSRRNFLKLAGLSTVVGLGAPAAANMLFKGEVQAAAAPQADEAGSGIQYGMVVDVKKFGENPELVQKCIDACHTIHNVPDMGNLKSEIKWIWPEKYNNSFPEHSHYRRHAALNELPVMLMCNHCANPPCVRACPTKATFKDKSTGIIVMDYHRCIGCRFCMAACPYGARSFNWQDPRPFIKEVNNEYPTRMRGVVEKCNFCAKRLAVGKQPACVEAAGQTKALVFGDINDSQSEISRILDTTFTIQRRPALGTKPSVFYII